MGSGLSMKAFHAAINHTGADNLRAFPQIKAEMERRQAKLREDEDGEKRKHLGDVIIAFS